jgi:hypothetical protein
MIREMGKPWVAQKHFDPQCMRELVYLEKTNWVHKRYELRVPQPCPDGCVVCKTRFGEAPEDIAEGYTTTADFAGGGLYEWLCEPCFELYKQPLRLRHDGSTEAKQPRQASETTPIRPSARTGSPMSVAEDN